MSAQAKQESSSDSSALPKPLRTVTPPYFGRRNSEMSYIGWAIFAILLVIMVPFLPIVLAVWAVSKVAESVANR